MKELKKKWGHGRSNGSQIYCEWFYLFISVVQSSIMIFSSLFKWATVFVTITEQVLVQALYSLNVLAAKPIVCFFCHNTADKIRIMARARHSIKSIFLYLSISH